MCADWQAEGSQSDWCRARRHLGTRSRYLNAPTRLGSTSRTPYLLVPRQWWETTPQLQAQPATIGSSAALSTYRGAKGCLPRKMTACLKLQEWGEGVGELTPWLCTWRDAEDFFVITYLLKKLLVPKWDAWCTNSVSTIRKPFGLSAGVDVVWQNQALLHCISWTMCLLINSRGEFITDNCKKKSFFGEYFLENTA